MRLIKKKPGLRKDRADVFLFTAFTKRCSQVGNWDLGTDNVDCLQTLISLFYFELNFLAFAERFEAICLNSSVVDEYILAAFALDKTKTFCIIEPFYGSCFSFTHGSTPMLLFCL